MSLRKGVELVETPTGGPGGGVGKPEGVGGPEGGIGGPKGGIRGLGGDGTGGPWWKDGPLGVGGGANRDGYPVVPEGGPCDEPFKEGTDPKIGAGFTGFPRKVGRPDMAGDPV